MAIPSGSFTFENTFSSPPLTLTGTSFTYTEGAGGGGDVANLDAVRTDQPVTITFNWQHSGPLASLPLGTWQFDIFLELMGPGESVAVTPSTLPFVTVPLGSTSAIQTISVAVGPGTITGVIPEGLYRVTARLMLKNTPTQSWMASFVDLGFVNWYGGM